MTNIYEHLHELATFNLEFVDKSGKVVSGKSYIKTLTDDFILINPPDFKDKNFTLEDGQEVNMVFYLENTVLVASSKVLGREISCNSGIKLLYPLDSRQVERRECLRVPLKVNFTLTKFINKDYKEFVEFSYVTRNVSGTGLSYTSDEPLKNYYDILCKIYLDDGESEPVVTKCDHVYTKKIEVNNSVSYINALTYSSISENDRARVVKECFKYQVVNKK